MADLPLKGLVAGYSLSVHETLAAAEASMREPRVMDGIDRVTFSFWRSQQTTGGKTKDLTVETLRG